MNPEDRLRQALHNEADPIEPAPDGWDRIESAAASAEQRVRFRRRGLLGLGAVAMIALVVGAITLLDDETQTVSIQPPAGSTATDEPDGSTTTATTAPTTTSTVASQGSGGTQAVWPVGASTYTEPVEAAKAFMRDYIGLVDPVAGEFREGDTQSGEVDVMPRADLPALTTTVLVRRVDGEHWWAVGAVSRNIRLDRPGPNESISSPVTVRGVASAFEGTVRVEVRQDGQGPGEHLGEGVVTGSGSEELGPFEGSIDFGLPQAAWGALVLTTASAEDGSIQQATVVRVQLDSPTSTNELCAVPAPEGRTVLVYLFCEEQSITAINRSIGERQDVLRAALEELLEGVTPAEDDAGLSSWFSPVTAGKLEDVTIGPDGTAIVDFTADFPEAIPNASTSNGSAMLMQQLNGTVFQFETVQRVEYRLDGSCEAFYNWLQGSCADNNPVTRESAAR